MKRFRKILVAVDTRLESNLIVDQAIEVAKSNDGAIRLVDVNPGFSWLTRLTTQDTTHLSELLEKEKREKLSALAAMISDQGIEASYAVLHGKSSVAIIKEAVEQKQDVVMAVSKGHDSRSSGFFGKTATRLLRQCPCPVWLVSPRTTAKFKHVLGCIDPISDDASELELDQRIVELTRSVAAYHDAKCSVLHAWQLDDRALLSARLDAKSVDQFAEEERAYHEEKMDDLLDQFQLKVVSENVHLIEGQAETAICEFVDADGVDLLVMGTVGRSGISGMLMGNTAEWVLSEVQCSVLALKPLGFKGSIRV
jgi:nucleotide-binding universal stress UspA family protein